MSKKINNLFKLTWDYVSLSSEKKKFENEFA